MTAEERLKKLRDKLNKDIIEHDDYVRLAAMDGKYTDSSLRDYAVELLKIIGY